MNETARKHKTRFGSESGVALVEFTLVFPLFLVLLLGMADFGRAFNYWTDGTHISHEGARYAAVGKNPGPGGTLAESIKSRASADELRNGSDSVTSAAKVCVSFPNGTSSVGDPVEVKVEFTYTFLSYVTSLFPSITNTKITSTATMRLERTPTFGAHCTA